MSQADLNQLLAYGEEVLAVFVGDDSDVVIMQNVLELSRQVATLRQKQSQQLQEIVEYLTSEFNMTEEASTRGSSSSLDDLNSIETSLQSKMEALRSQSLAVCNECQQLKEEQSKVQKEHQALREQQQNHKAARASALPKARCDVNLYSNITNLRWQFNSAPYEIKGYICNNNDVKTFNLNSQEVSRFFITNYLWDLIEES